MKVNELFKPTITDFNTRLEFIKYLQHNGEELEELGSGLHANVYASMKNPNVAIKVVKLDDPPLNDPYLTYVRYCMKMKSNPFLPKIYSVKVYKLRDHQPPRAARSFEYKNFAVVTMERLIPYHNIPKTAELTSGDFMTQMADIEVGSDSDLDQGAAQYGVSDVNALKRVAQRTRNVLLKNAIIVVLGTMQKRSAVLDLHAGNVMWRKEGSHYQLVITDPLV